jgi:hypothetical protein
MTIASATVGSKINYRISTDYDALQFGNASMCLSRTAKRLRLRERWSIAKGAACSCKSVIWQRKSSHGC